MIDTEVLHRLESLVSPFGVVADVSNRPVPRGLDEAFMVASYFGDCGSSRDNTGSCDANKLRRSARPRSLKLAAGRTFGDPAQARLVAIAEGAERYSAGELQKPVVWAPYRELDGAALDLRRVPRCSARELSTPGCPLRALNPDAPMHWTRGVDMTSGAPTWVPTVMACYAVRDVAPSEQFWYRISTGYAVHSDPAEALVRGICEVIERDSIAVLWQQMLTLPIICERYLSGPTDRMLAWSRKHFIESYLFDATTDIGVPTVFCLQIAPHDTRAAQVAGCATDRTIEAAAQHALLEACTGRSVFHLADEPPADFRDFKYVSEGSHYMARPSRAAAFDFLVEGARDRIGPERESLPENSVATLNWLIAALSRRDMTVIAVDRTTRELAAVGLTAVSVVIPDLQPMSLLPLAQYRAHRRLYSAPRLMGYPSLTEEELNSWPVPFA
jgi:ribosomal protein S12 methylthiotransferase accessory factor